MLIQSRGRCHGSFVQGGGSETVLAQTDWESATLGDIPFNGGSAYGTTAYGQVLNEQSTGVCTIVNDPTGGGKGKVFQVSFPSGGGTRMVFYRGSSVAGDIGMGETGYIDGYFYIPGSADASALRKLTYCQPVSSTSGTVGSNAYLFIVTGEENGNLYCEYSGYNGSTQTQDRITISPTVPISKGAWHRLKTLFHLNSAYNVADGWIEVYLDGVLKASVYNVIIASYSGLIGGATDRIHEIQIGDQYQGGTNAEVRYWDTVTIAKVA